MTPTDEIYVYDVSAGDANIPLKGGLPQKMEADTILKIAKSVK